VLQGSAHVLGLPPIAWVFCGKTLIATPVVTGDACHELLSVGVRTLRDLHKEPSSGSPAQGAGDDAAVQYLNFTGFAGAVREAEIGVWEHRVLLACGA
jgi:hypothetical protein